MDNLKTFPVFRFGIYLKSKFDQRARCSGDGINKLFYKFFCLINHIPNFTNRLSVPDRSFHSTDSSLRDFSDTRMRSGTSIKSASANFPPESLHDHPTIDLIPSTRDRARGLCRTHDILANGIVLAVQCNKMNLKRCNRLWPDHSAIIVTGFQCPDKSRRPNSMNPSAHGRRSRL